METINKELRGNILKGLDEIRPFLKNDGGDISLIDIDEKEGSVKVQLEGACATCTINHMTMKTGVEMTIKKYAPQIKEVHNIDDW